MSRYGKSKLIVPITVVIKSNFISRVHFIFYHKHPKQNHKRRFSAKTNTAAKTYKSNLMRIFSTLRAKYQNNQRRIGQI